MSPLKLRELIAQGESFTVEFKGEERHPLSDRELIETVVCMANGQGGKLLLGVEDDGRITGARPRPDFGLDPLRIQALIANRTRPSLSCNVTVEEVEGKPILVIEVPDASTPVGTADGMYLRRAILGRGEPGCLPFHFHEMQMRQATRGLLDYSALVVPDAQWDDLDPLEFERFRRIIRESRGQGDFGLLELPDVELAKALGAVEANHKVHAVRVLGLLFFGREDAIRRFLPAHEVAFQVFSGLRVEVNDFFYWPLLRLMEELLVRFRARNREEELMMGLFRIGVPDYSERAFRECLANALVHRDYARLGAVYVQWYDDRIEVSNPGGFPEGVNLHNLLVTPPRPRNPLLADAFKRAGLVERTGRGIDIIFHEQLSKGRPAPIYDRSTNESVVVALPGGPANLKFVRFLIEEEHRNRRPLSLDELLILNQIWLERRLSTAEAAALIQKGRSEARAVLERLTERGLLEARGERGGRTYHMSSALYRRLDGKAAYIRTRGFEREQQEEMILQYVQRHGRITRGEAAELCQLTGQQAYRLLRHLVESGQLRPTAERGRKVAYELKR